MIGLELLESAILLGGIVLLAGCYGLLYGVGRLAGRPAITRAGYVCYGLQCAVAAMVVATAPLTGPWKLVVVVCTIGFLGIPPVTWRFLERTH